MPSRSPAMTSKRSPKPKGVLRRSPQKPQKSASKTKAPDSTGRIQPIIQYSIPQIDYLVWQFLDGFIDDEDELIKVLQRNRPSKLAGPLFVMLVLANPSCLSR